MRESAGLRSCVPGDASAAAMRDDPGSGEINFATFYRAIRTSGYTGRIAMEYRPLGDPVASLARSISGMRSALAA